jgi:5'-3' exonuclease
MLSLLIPEELMENIYLWRHDVDKREFVNGKQNKNFGKEQDSVYYIDALRYKIYNDLSIGRTQVLTIDYTTRDFVLMLYTIGNDFVPPIVSLVGRQEPKETIDLMFNVYTRLHYQTTPNDGDPEIYALIKKDNSINWNRFAQFMKILGSFEARLLESMAKKRLKYPLPILEQSVKRKTNESGEYVIDLNFEKFKDLHYQKALNPTTEKGKDFMLKYMIEGYPYTKNGVQTMIYQYIKGLQWIFQYYCLGTRAVTSKYVYCYHYAPLISDIAETIDHLVINNAVPTIDLIKDSVDDPFITPIHQLISVMPRKSWNLIPEPYQSLMPKRFTDICPEKFPIVLEGTNKEHTKIPLLPFVDPERLILETRDFPVPNEYLESRNIFIVTNRNPRPPRIPTSIKEVQKMYEREAKKKQIIVETSPEFGNVPDEKLTEEDLEITYNYNSTHVHHNNMTVESARSYIRESKAKIKKEEEKEQEEIVKKVMQKRPTIQWTTSSLM